MNSYPTSSPTKFFPSASLSTSFAATAMSQFLILRPRCLISPSSPGLVLDAYSFLFERLRSWSLKFAKAGYTYHAKSHKLGSSNVTMRKHKSMKRQYKNKSIVRCNIGLQDFIGGDLVKFDLGQWLSDVEEHKAIAIYTPHEGGYEGRYLNRLRYKGYQFLDLSARGLGDPETTLTKFHPVCPPHLGKQPIARWYFPPEVDYRLSLLPANAAGLVVWVIEAKVLSKAELQFLCLLPTLRPRVRVIAECGNWRKVVWRPLKEAAGLSVTQT